MDKTFGWVFTGLLILAQVSFLPLTSAIAVHQKAESGHRVLDLTKSPVLKDGGVQAQGRSVNVSFFIPALSLFQLASQYMPQMFPAFSTATTQSRQSKTSPNEAEAASSNSKKYFARASRTRRDLPHDGDHTNMQEIEEPSWLEKFIQSGVVGGF